MDGRDSFKKAVEAGSGHESAWTPVRRRRQPIPAPVAAHM